MNQPVECDGMWFTRCGLNVLWDDDRADLEDKSARIDAGEAVDLGPDYDMWQEERTGAEFLLPSTALLTPRQRAVVLALVDEGIRLKLAC